MTANICRVCLNQELLVNIFKKSGFLTIATKLISIAKVHIAPEDGLPDAICSKCVQKLDNCIEFIELCETSDVKLRALLENNCMENKLMMDNSIENDNFLSDNTSLSPKSETEQVLFIDESIDHSIMDHTSLTDDLLENETIMDTKKENINHSKLINKKTQKQQCFTCGKVMSSRQLNDWNSFDERQIEITTSCMSVGIKPRFRLKTHMRTHTGERPFSCPHCSKNFSLAQNLKVHLRIHTGEKPLQCPICGDAFAQSAGLAAHKRKHSGVLPYDCKLCPRAFRTIGHLQYHTRRHTGEKNFECDTCGRAFITRSDLKQHLLTHTGARPHVCCICGLRLTRASHLKRHMNRTHEKTVYSCDHCPAEFIKKSELEKHIKTHDD